MMQPTPGSRIKELREERFWSMKELAKRVYVTPSQISRIESGEIRSINSDLLTLFADVFSVSADYILGRTTIRSQKNYDVSSLQLTEKAVRKIISGQLDMQVLNLLIVWGLTGFWHGASWNFLLWGLYYALLLILEKLFLLKWLDKLPKVVRHIYTIFCFMMGWTLFAITDMSQLGQYFSAMFTAPLWDGAAAYLLRSNVVLLVLAAVGSTTLPVRVFNAVESRLGDKAAVALRSVGVAFLLLLSVAFLVGDSYNPFLYFRF